MTDLKKIEDDSLEWKDGVPIAPTFDDVYYSVDGGLDESNYVFVGGIGAPEVWHGKDKFTIAETGFGTGLNFLATWQKWQESNPDGRLIFISVEQFPLSKEALEKAHKSFPEVSDKAAQLRQAWPPASPGFHHRFFNNGKIELILIFGEAVEGYSRLNAKVNAWYLDGFAPAKNPSMWREELFTQMARLSAPKASFATFTSAGFVKRGLIAAGFEVQKTKGFGRKRERLIGHMPAPGLACPPAYTPGWFSLPKGGEAGTIAVIGAGIAGRSLAAALFRRGHTPTVFSNGPCASEVPSAILAPAFQAERQPASNFIEAAFAHACTYPAYQQHWQGNRGTFVASQTEEDRHRQRKVQKRLNWSLDDLQGSAGGLFYKQAGSLNTVAALETIWPSTDILKTKIEQIEQTSDGWLVITDNTRHICNTLVLATGASTPFLLPEADNLRMGANAGHITLVNDSESLPQTAYSSTAYLTAPEKGKRTAGSTFEDAAGIDPAIWAPSPHAYKMLSEKIQANLAFPLSINADNEGWDGIRATSHDYLPLVGAVPDWKQAKAYLLPLGKNKNAALNGTLPLQQGLYLHTSFGSKGYQQAPYASEILTALILGEPLPVPHDIVPLLSPARFLVRRIIRGELG